MTDKKNERLGLLFVVLMIFNVIMGFNSDWDTYYLLVNIAFTAIGLLICKRIHQQDIKLLSVVFAWTVVTLPFTDGGLGSALTFFITLAMMIVFSSLCISEKLKKVLVLVCFIGILVMLEKSLAYRDHYKLALFFNKNPNSIAGYTVYFFLFLTIFLDLSKQRNKVFFFLSVLLTIYTVSNCRSRGALIALVTFLFLLILPHRIWTGRLLLCVVGLIVAVGTAIPIIYVILYRNGYELQLLGKSLFTGRELIWSEMFSQFGQKPIAYLVGLGSNTRLWKHDLNVHNNFFNIIVNFGIVGYFLYFFVTFRILKRAADSVSDITIKKALLTFVCTTFVLGFFESTSLNNNLAPFVYFGLVYANGKIQQNRSATEM